VCRCKFHGVGRNVIMTKATTEGGVDRSSAGEDSHPLIPMSKTSQHELAQTEDSPTKIRNVSTAEESGSTFKKAVVWKEKVGFGTKLSSTKWEKRLLIIDGRYLAYFDIEANGEGSEMRLPWKDKGGHAGSFVCVTAPPSASEAKTKKGSSSVISLLAEGKNIQRMKAVAADVKSDLKSTAKEMKDKAEKKAAYIKGKATKTSSDFVNKAASKNMSTHKEVKASIITKSYGSLSAKTTKLPNESEALPPSRGSSSSLSDMCLDNNFFSPRGHIEMVHHEVSITPSGTQHASPPTPFVVTIRFKHDDYSTIAIKWKICFQTHQEQLEWVFQINLLVTQAAIADCAAKQQHHEEKTYLTQYFGFDSHEAPNAAVSTGNVFHAVEHVDLTFSSFTKDDKLMTTPPRRMSVAYSPPFIKPPLQTPHIDPVSLRKDSIVPGASTVQMLGTILMTANGALLAYGVWSGTALVCVACGFNLVAFSYAIAKIKVIFLDLKSDKEEMKFVLQASQRMFRAGRDDSEEKLTKFGGGLGPLMHEDEDDASSIDGSVVDMAASMNIPTLPCAGASTIQLKEGMEGTDNVSADGVHLPAWRNVSASELKTRALGYLQHHQKRNSPETLYECVAVDVLESAARIREVASRVQLPSSEGSNENPWHSPEIFIVSIAIPSEAKMGLSSSDDGLGFTIIVYSVMKQETRKILEQISRPDFDPSDESQWATKEMAERVNAVRLFEKWCQKSPDDPTFQARFKMVPDALNLADLGLPSWIVKYKDKPILIKRSGVTGTVYKSDRSLEFHVNFHAFPYLAKQAFAYLRDAYFKLIIANAGFVIEGRDEDELPEAIISCVQLCNPDPATAVQAVDFFKGTSAVSKRFDP
jgi:hypothetical protein